MRAYRLGKIVLLVLLSSTVPVWAGPVGFVQTNLVSNVPGLAAVTDSQLVNPWGLSFSATSPFWVADNGAGVSTLYNGAGTKQALVVTIPPAPGSAPGTAGVPTGTVFNGNSSDFSGDRFLFATEDGTIAGWQGGLGTTAAVRVDNSGSDAIYKGLAIGADRIFATDFAHGTVDAFNNAYAPVLGGAFVDPTLPAGYVPFGIQNLGGTLYVTFANVTTGNEDENHGPGLGYVDAFDTNGNFLRRVVSGGPLSALNAPWGLAIAPAGFGDFGGKLLVGNFGDGRINAFDPITGAFAGALNDPQGNPIEIEGLWGLAFGNSGPGFSPNKLYFAAGIDGEANGLFGSLEPVPEPATLLLIASAAPWVIARRRQRP
jgi:uncharacterized protein (TIGR03118 family)